MSIIVKASINFKKLNTTAEHISDCIDQRLGDWLMAAGTVDIKYTKETLPDVIDSIINHDTTSTVKRFNDVGVFTIMEGNDLIAKVFNFPSNGRRRMQNFIILNVVNSHLFMSVSNEMVERLRGINDYAGIPMADLKVMEEATKLLSDKYNIFKQHDMRGEFFSITETHLKQTFDKTHRGIIETMEDWLNRVIHSEGLMSVVSSLINYLRTTKNLRTNFNPDVPFLERVHQARLKHIGTNAKIDFDDDDDDDLDDDGMDKERIYIAGEYVPANILEDVLHKQSPEIIELIQEAILEFSHIKAKLEELRKKEKDLFDKVDTRLKLIDGGE